MQTNNRITDYFGATYFIEKNKEKDLIIFCVDENNNYLELLKNMLDRPNFSVFTFSSGEECLEYLQLKPNLVILDYHLNRVNPNAMNGDKIAELIQQKVPEAEIIMISSDYKFNLISELHLSSVKNVVYKDSHAFEKIKIESEKVLEKKLKSKTNYKLLFFGALLFFVIENILLLFLFA